MHHKMQATTSPERSERARRKTLPSRLNKSCSIMSKKGASFSVRKSKCKFENGKVFMEVLGEPKSWLRCTPIPGTKKMHNTNALPQQRLQSAIKRAIGDLDLVPVPIFPAKTPLAVTITFFLARPQYHFGTNKRRIFCNVRDEYCRIIPTKVPDIDNLIKFMLDKPFKGVLFADDKVVSAVYAKKRWDSSGGCHGRTVFRIEEDIIEVEEENPL